MSTLVKPLNTQIPFWAAASFAKLVVLIAASVVIEEGLLAWRGWLGVDGVVVNARRFD
jgi:hypothetical protein